MTRLPNNPLRLIMTNPKKDVAPSDVVTSADSFNSPLGGPRKGELAIPILVQSRRS